MLKRLYRIGDVAIVILTWIQRYRKYNKRLKQRTGFAYPAMSITLQAAPDIANRIKSVIILMLIDKLCL